MDATGVLNANRLYGNLVSEPIPARRDDALPDDHRLLAGAGLQLSAGQRGSFNARRHSVRVVRAGGSCLCGVALDCSTKKELHVWSDGSAGFHRACPAATVLA